MPESLRRAGERWGALISILIVLGGCSDDDAEHAANAASDPATWHQDIAPIVSEKCMSCHQSGGIAPFSMQTYASVKDWAGAMASAVEEGRMPPFLAEDTDACKPRLPWAADLRLNDAQKQLLRRWADAGAPEGKAKPGVTYSAPPAVALEREDVVMKLPEPITVEGTRDIHTCIVVDPGLDHDTYVKGRLVTAGNPRVLHHLVTYIVQPGQNADGSKRDKSQLEAAIRDLRGVGIGGRYDCFGGVSLPGFDIAMLDAWAPGGLPNLAPPDSAQPLDKNALVLLDVHYHPTGESETDSDTKLSLMISDERPSMISRILLLGNVQKHQESANTVSDLIQQPGEDHPEFTIPAGEKDHIEEMTTRWKLPQGLSFHVYASGTHMHYVGRDMRVTLESAQGDDQCLIETPSWNFNWQRLYTYDAPFDDLPPMGDGDTVRLRCSYDNTMDNHFVAQALADRGLDAPIRVNLGEDTLDEMCVGAIGVIYPNTN